MEEIHENPQNVKCQMENNSEMTLDNCVGEHTWVYLPALDETALCVPASLHTTWCTEFLYVINCCGLCFCFLWWSDQNDGLGVHRYNYSYTCTMTTIIHTMTVTLNLRVFPSPSDEPFRNVSTFRTWAPHFKVLQVSWWEPREWTQNANATPQTVALRTGGV